MKNANAAMGGLEWLLLVVLALLWGGSFFFVGVAVKALPPFTLVALRVGTAAAALHLLLRSRGQRLPGGGEVWRAWPAC